MRSRKWAVKRHKQPKKRELQKSTDATKKPLLLSQFTSLPFTVVKTTDLIDGIKTSAKRMQVSDRFLYLSGNVFFIFVLEEQ